MPDDEIVWEDVNMVDPALYDGLIFDDPWDRYFADQDASAPDDQDSRFF